PLPAILSSQELVLSHSYSVLMFPGWECSRIQYIMAGNSQRQELEAHSRCRDSWEADAELSSSTADVLKCAIMLLLGREWTNPLNCKPAPMKRFP
ncbi:mCG145480, partial [Mus musculus]